MRLELIHVTTDEFKKLTTEGRANAAGVSEIELVEGEAPEGRKCEHIASVKGDRCFMCGQKVAQDPTPYERERELEAQLVEANARLKYHDDNFIRLTDERAAAIRRAEMADARNALLFKEKADAIARIAELSAQLADAQREIERSHEIIIGQNEEIVKAKAEAARLRTIADKIIANAEKSAQPRGLEKHFKTFRSVAIQLQEEDIAALRRAAPAEEVKE